jgi:hypothetical protein
MNDAYRRRFIKKIALFFPNLDEQLGRLYLASEAQNLGQRRQAKNSGDKLK